jgi:CubicO group peptidase (beta-lactamase class C family)
MKKILFIFLSLCVSIPAYSEIYTKAIDRIVELTIPVDGPGGALLICKDDKIIYRKAFGYADIDARVPNTAETVFQIGSISKMMTAAGILLLAEQKKLSLQDQLTKYIPDFIEPGNKVTIENLLLHNSGIKSYTGIPEWNNGWDSKRSLEETINLVKKKEFDFQPGEKFMYNNSGFAILAFIIEKASGMSYDEFMKKNIFVPLGMNHTRHGANTDDLGLKAKGHTIDPREKKITRAVFTEFAQLSGAGSIVSTVDDLLTFDRAMRDRKLLSKDSWEKSTSKMIIIKDPSIYYGYGWVIQNIKKHDAICHNGGMAGFMSSNYNFVNDKITVIFLSNADFINADSMVMQVAAYMFDLDTDRRNPVSISADILKKYEGIYLLGKEKYEIKLVNGKLTYNILDYKYLSGTLIPTSENTFYIDGRYDVYISIPVEKDKPVSSAILELNGLKLKLIKEGFEAKTIELKEDQLKIFEGIFKFSNTVDAKIYIENGKLKAFVKGQPVYTLNPIGDNKFMLEGFTGFTFIFEADSSGKITGLISSQPNGDFKAKRKAE